MPKVKISEYSATANSNTDVASINIDEGCAPSGINNAIRAVMGHLKDFQQGTYGDPFNGPVNGTLGATTASTANVTTLTTSSTVTHNGGTANGVAYLNGSKVLTTGSALVFDGTKLSIGSGNSTAAGLTAGYFGASGYGAIWSTSVTPSTTNFSFLTNGTSTVLNGSSNVTFQVNNADSMALTSTGLGIGTSSPAARLSVIAASANSTAATIGGIEYGGSKRGLTIKTFNSAGGDDCGVEFNAANGLAGYGAFKFAADTTTLATIDTSGNLLVGDTSAYSGSRLSVKTGNNNGTTHAWYAKNSSATVLGYQRDDGLFNTGAATNSPYNFTTAAAANLFVDSSGTFYRSTSSLKYKTDVQDATHGLAEVLSLRPVTYRGKNDGETIFGGLIAEEVDAAGLTEFVQYAEDGTPDALAYGNMVSLCIKAIQQQQAIIQSLTARITALEGA